MFRSLVRVFAATAAFVCLSAVTQAQDAKAVFAKTQAAVLNVYSSKGSGTGFVVGDGTLILTCYHVVEDSVGVIKVGSKELQTAEVVSTSPENDIALLRVSQPYATRLKLTKGQIPATGTKIFVIGSPKGFDKTLSEGIISGIRRDGDLALVQITAPISPGSSGSPIMTASGEVIAMAQGGFDNAQNLNFGVSAYNINQVIKAMKVAKSTEQPTERKPSGKVNPKYVKPDGHFDVKRYLRDMDSDDEKVVNDAVDSQDAFGAKAIPDFFAYLEETSPGFSVLPEDIELVLEGYGTSAKPFFVQAIKNGSKVTRYYALVVIDKRIKLNRLLSSPPSEGFEWVKDADVKDILLDTCEDSNIETRSQGVSVCGALKYKYAAAQARKLLGDAKNDLPFRVAGFRCLLDLETMHSEDLDELSGGFFGDKLDTSILFDCFESIETDVALETIQRLVRNLAKSTDKRVRKLRGSAVSLLIGFKQPARLEYVRGLLKDENPSVQIEAARVIGAALDEITAEEVILLICSDDDSVSYGAAVGVGASMSKKAYELLTEGIRQKVHIANCIHGLGELMDKRAIEFLKPYVNDKDEEIATAAKDVIESLKKIKD